MLECSSFVVASKFRRCATFDAVVSLYAKTMIWIDFYSHRETHQSEAAYRPKFA